MEFDFDGLGEVDGDDVEAAGSTGGDAFAEEMGHAYEFLPLFAINREFSRHNAAIGAGFDFDKAESVAFPSDEVEFAAATGGAPVSGDNGVSVTAQVKVCSFFATTSGFEMLGFIADGRKPRGEEIEDTEDGADERHRVQG